eukprot:808463_1
MLKQSVDDIIENAATSESALVSRMAEHTRIELHLDATELNENINGCILRNVLVSNEPESEEPMTGVFRGLKQTIDTGKEEKGSDKATPKLEITVEDGLMDEYAANHRLISAAFPYIFPFGSALHYFIGFSNEMKYEMK